MYDKISSYATALLLLRFCEIHKALCKQYYVQCIISRNYLNSERVF